jgi:hypothetical protein
MFRLSWCPRRYALATLFVCLSYSAAFAHCFVGARFFPATLATDDPCVADEMSVPTVAWSKTGDVPPATEWDISVDFAKRITEDFGITIGSMERDERRARRGASPDLPVHRRKPIHGGRFWARREPAAKVFLRADRSFRPFRAFS